MLKRFISYYKPHKKIFVLDMIASLIVSVIGIFYPIVTRIMVSEFTSGSKKIYLITIMGIFLLTLYFVRMLLDYFIQYYGHVMGVRMQAQMRRDIFSHLQKLPYSYFDNNETGKIMSRLTSDLFEVSELAHHGPENLIISSITIILSFVYLSTINIWLTLIVFTCVPVLFLIAFKLRKKMSSAFKESRKAVAEINGAIESSISGIRVTKAFTNSELEKEKFEVGNTNFQNARKDAYKAMGQFHSSTSFLTSVFNVVVLIAGGVFLYLNNITVADYSAFIVSIGLFITPVTTLINFMEQFQEGASGFSRFCEIMDLDPEKDSDEAYEIDNIKGNIRFENVSCDYGTEKEAISNVSFEIDAGKIYALVGPSGGGKTTICHLIPHFYNLSSGEIYIDNREINTIKLESLRKNIGIVQQDIYLFNSTIKDNILYGKPEATDEEVVEAAKRANIHEYIASLPDGYETIIGERGVKLSGGQKQRLSIARVFLKNPPILILDEATSALDNATEVMIQESLDELCHGRTTIVVAHRLSTIRNADMIAVVEDGKIKETGTHKELMDKNGKYASLNKAIQ